MGKTLTGLLVLAVLFGILVFLESGGHPELPLWAPFQEGNLVKGETATELKHAPQGYNEGQIEATIAVLQPGERGTIRQGGDIPYTCAYVGYKWWCRVVIAKHRLGWTEAWRLQKVNG